MFLNAEPHSIGTISFAIVRVRKAKLDLLLGERAALEILVHQLFVGFGGGLDHLLAPFLGDVDQLSRDLAYSNFMPWLASSQIDRLHLDQVDHASKLSSAPIGIWIGTGLALRRGFIWS